MVLRVACGLVIALGNENDVYSIFFFFSLFLFPFHWAETRPVNERLKSWMNVNCSTALSKGGGGVGSGTDIFISESRCFSCERSKRAIT